LHHLPIHHGGYDEQLNAKESSDDNGDEDEDDGTGQQSAYSFPLVVEPSPLQPPETTLPVWK